MPVPVPELSTVKHWVLLSHFTEVLLSWRTPPPSDGIWAPETPVTLRIARLAPTSKAPAPLVTAPRTNGFMISIPPCLEANPEAFQERTETVTRNHRGPARLLDKATKGEHFWYR